MSVSTIPAEFLAHPYKGTPDVGTAVIITPAGATVKFPGIDRATFERWIAEGVARVAGVAVKWAQIELQAPPADPA
jgi:hypothetical protein